MNVNVKLYSPNMGIQIILLFNIAISVTGAVLFVEYDIMHTS